MASMAEIQSLIADQLGIDEGEVTPDARIVEDLGAESSDVANLVASIEDKYDFTVPESEIENLITVQDVFVRIQQHTG